MEIRETKTTEITVKQSDTAKALGSGTLEVLATPRVVALMENAAMNLAMPQVTVGTKMSIEHIAATPVGMKVSATAKLVEIDSRKLVFEVEAFDERERIAFGTHERFIINAEKFMIKAESKKGVRV